MDKIYEVVTIKEIKKGFIKRHSDFVITDTHGCFLSYEEALNFVRESFLKETFRESPNAQIERFAVDGLPDAWYFYKQDVVIAIKVEWIGFDKAMVQFMMKWYNS